MKPLSKQTCKACEGGVEPMTRSQIESMMPQVSQWTFDASEVPFKITRQYTFKNFKHAMDFVNEVAEIAEHQGHHPDISISWNRVTLTLFTHAIDGLSINDFIVAAKIDQLVI